MNPDEEKIRTAHTTWMAAVNSGDLDRLLGLMTADAVFLNPGKKPFGPDGFGPNFTEAHQRVLIDCTSELEEVVVVGSLGYTRSRDALSVTPRAGGKTTRLAGERITIYRQQPDGRWLLARDAHTLTVVQA